MAATPRGAHPEVFALPLAGGGAGAPPPARWWQRRGRQFMLC